MPNDKVYFDPTEIAANLRRSAITPGSLILYSEDPDVEPKEMKIPENNKKWKTLVEQLQPMIHEVTRIEVMDPDGKLITAHSLEELRKRLLAENNKRKYIEEGVVNITEKKVVGMETEDERLIYMMIEAQDRILDRVSGSFEMLLDRQISFSQQMGEAFVDMINVTTNRIIGLEESLRATTEQNATLIRQIAEQSGGTDDLLNDIARSTVPQILAGAMAQPQAQAPRMIPPAQTTAPATQESGLTSDDIGAALKMAQQAGITMEQIGDLVNMAKNFTETTEG